MRVRHQDFTQRGHGFTTLQMQRAARGALFIWPVQGSLSYAKALAAKLGRDDLKIVGPAILEQHGAKLRGCSYPSIVLDHACELSEEEYALLRDVRMWCLPRESVERNI